MPANSPPGVGATSGVITDEDDSVNELPNPAEYARNRVPFADAE
jgi:hypothetical protein